MQVFLIVLIGSYAILDAMTIGLGDRERYGYALLSCVLVVTLLVSKRYSRQTATLRGISQAYLALLGMGFVMTSLQPEINWLYVIGDSVSLAMPLFLLTLADKSKGNFFNDQMFRWLLLVLLIASVTPVVVPSSWGHYSGRFQQPPLILAVLTSIGLLRPASASQFFSNLIIFVLVLLLTLMSGARSALLIYLGVGVSLFAIGQVSRQIACLGILLATGLMVVLSTGILASAIPEDLSNLRFTRFVEKYNETGLIEGILLDQSMNNRVLEAEDALYEMWHHGSLLQLLLGWGHGATFSGVTAYYGDRAQSDGQVHHIHFGLVLLYYRYGIPGLFVFFWLAWAAVRQLLALRAGNLPQDIYYPSLVFSLGTLGYLTELLLFNQIVDPVLSLTIAGFLVTRDLALSAKRHRSTPTQRQSWKRKPVKIEAPRRLVSTNSGLVN